MHEDTRTAQAWPAMADARLSSAASTSGQVDPRSVANDAEALLHQATFKATQKIDTPDLAYRVQMLAETNPAQAKAVRAALTERLGAQDAGEFNRLLAGDTHFGDGSGHGYLRPPHRRPHRRVEERRWLCHQRRRPAYARHDDAERGRAAPAGWPCRVDGRASSTADAMRQSADAIDQAAQQHQLPVIEPSNIAQQGGADIETTVEIGVGVTGALRGSAKLALRGAASELESGSTAAVKASTTQAVRANAGFDTANLESKLKGYLLNPAHPQNQTKAEWFDKALGFNQTNWQELASQLHFDTSRATATKTTPYGQTFEQTIPLTGANGRTIDTTFVFMRDTSGSVRLVTGIPAKR